MRSIPALAQLALAVLPVQATAAPPENIKVLTGQSEEEIARTMLYIRGALGVGCGHCHVEGEWARDDKGAKQTARRMLRMVEALNRDQFDGELAVSCFTCHRGRLRPATTLPLLSERPALAAAAPIETRPATPAVDAVLARYRDVTGGEAWSRLTTRVMKGQLRTSEPAVYPLEVYQRAPDQFFKRIVVEATPFAQVYDGHAGWSADNRGTHDQQGDDLERLRRRAVFAAPADLRRVYRTLSVEGETTLAGQPVVVLTGSASSGPRDHLYFSTRTGLLRRIASATVTPFGELPIRFDFDDYRRVDGVGLPFRIRETDADYSYLWEIATIRHEVPVDEALFRR